MSPIPRYAARRDDLEREIVDALRACGWTVHQIGARGFPDLLLSKGKRLVLMEVKSATGKLTPAQEAFHGKHPGTIYIVRSVEDALAVVNPPKDAA